MNKTEVIKMKETKFKVGDRVKLLGHPTKRFVGKECLIIALINIFDTVEERDAFCDYLVKNDEEGAAIVRDPKFDAEKGYTTAYYRMLYKKSRVTGLIGDNDLELIEQ